MVDVRNTWVEINTAALAHNVRRVRDYAPNARVLAMVKADAYGHGAAACLAGVQDADALGVACMAEALALRAAGWQKPIVLIEGVFSQAEWRVALAQNLTCVVHHETQLAWALQDLPHRAFCTEHPPTIWLKLNTGMNRLGFTANGALEVARQLHTAGYQIVLVSHFANADVPDDPYNTAQITLFVDVLARLRAELGADAVQASLCNSAGLINFPEVQFDWVRPGIMLYGGSPMVDVAPQALDLRPVMQFGAAVMAVHALSVGASVGYGSRWQATRPTRLGVVSVGYADGYPRVVSEAAYVLAEGMRLPIVGRVAMDMLMVDMTDAQAVGLGSTVTLWGDGLSVDTVASWTNTLNYELLCHVGMRPTRRVLT